MNDPIVDLYWYKIVRSGFDLQHRLHLHPALFGPCIELLLGDIQSLLSLIMVLIARSPIAEP